MSEVVWPLCLEWCGPYAWNGVAPMSGVVWPLCLEWCGPYVWSGPFINFITVGLEGILSFAVAPANLCPSLPTPDDELQRWPPLLCAACDQSEQVPHRHQRIVGGGVGMVWDWVWMSGENMSQTAALRIPAAHIQ